MMSGGDVFSYARHQPEHTLLYQLIERYWPDCQSHLSEADRCVPRHVEREFNEYLECGRLENGFLRVRGEDCHLEHLVAFSCKRRGFCPRCGARRMAETAALLVDDVLPHKPIRQWVLSFPYSLRFLLSNSPQVMSGVLGIVNRAISTHLIKKAGFKGTQAQTGAVTLIQRFGSALNLNVHFHMLFIDGVYQEKHNGQLRFHRVNAATTSELNTLVATISQRVAGHLERQGLLARDDESSYLTLNLQDDDPMNQLQGHFITYRIAVVHNRAARSSPYKQSHPGKMMILALTRWVKLPVSPCMPGWLQKHENAKNWNACVVISPALQYKKNDWH
jgi:hypothetical protein